MLAHRSLGLWARLSLERGSLVRVEQTATILGILAEFDGACGTVSVELLAAGGAELTWGLLVCGSHLSMQPRRVIGGCLPLLESHLG